MGFYRYLAIIIIMMMQINTLFSNGPYELKPLKEVVIFTGGAAIGITGLILENDIEPLSVPEINELNISDVNRFDRSACYNWSPELSELSDYLMFGLGAAPVLLTLNEKIRSDLIPVSVIYMQTVILSSSIPLVFKGTVQRIRPYAYNNEVSLLTKQGRETKESFISRHVTVSFASAVFLSKIFQDYVDDEEWNYVIWGSSLSLAGLVGYLRYASGKHFPSDILTGAVIGSLIGYFVPDLHHTKDKLYSLSVFNNGIYLSVRF